MAFNIAINGYGRIGRALVRAIHERHLADYFKIVAVNDLSNAKTLSHLTAFDTTHGRFAGDVDYDQDHIVINGQRTLVTHCADPSGLPWSKLGIDLLFECSGKFTSKEKAAAHVKAGAKKVLIGAPAGPDVDLTVVYGINHQALSADHKIVSNASCTTNCLGILLKPLLADIGLEQGFMTTIHAYTNDQSLVDLARDDLYRARAAAHNMIPTTTGATKALSLVMPELEHKLTGYSMRVPTINVSALDLTFTATQNTHIEEIHQLMQKASAGPLKGLLHYNDLPLVSSDFNHHSASTIFDAGQTKVLGRLVKLLAWYDNEWGFTNRLLDVANYWLSLKK